MGLCFAEQHVNLEGVFLVNMVYRVFHNVLRDYKHLLQENTKRLRRTLHTVVFDIDNSLAAVPVDFFEQKTGPNLFNVIFSG
jgi:hypothetical protein